MPKIYKVIFTRFAEEDLIEILEYYNQVNADYAQRLLLTIEKRLNELKTILGRGRIVPELEKQNIVEYRELIEGNYRIIYSVQEHIVIVLTIIDARRNFEDLIIKKIMKLYP